jgi:hypothetical protein
MEVESKMKYSDDGKSLQWPPFKWTHLENIRNQVLATRKEGLVSQSTRAKTVLCKCERLQGRSLTAPVNPELMQSSYGSGSTGSQSFFNAGNSCREQSGPVECQSKKV